MEQLCNVSHLNGETLLRLALAFLLGGAIGMERQIHGRPAGLRTHMLVCVGAACIMIGARSYPDFSYPLLEEARITIDPGRIVAGIMTGIGFLGAGAIIRMGNIIRGLTTAACIWFVAALGIIIGDGLYGLATVTTVSVLAVLILLQRFEYHLQPVHYHSIDIIGPLEKLDSLESGCKKVLEEEDIRIQDRDYCIEHETGRFTTTFHVRLKGRDRSGEVVRLLTAIPEITQIIWR